MDIDFARRRVLVAGREVELTDQNSGCCTCWRPTRASSSAGGAARENLARRHLCDGAGVDTLVKRLRRRIEGDPAPRMADGLGVGCKFADVS
jgi:hypothetical protein